MAYTTIDNPADYFNTKLYTGNGSTQSITGVGFQPDWVWIKVRSQAHNHYLYDAVRGAQEKLSSNANGAEIDMGSTGLTAFNSDGFSIGNDTDENASGETYASWNWLAANGTASNTDGSITTTVSANTTAGFSIVSYTGTGSNATVGHGLGVAPSVIILKGLVGTREWAVYHTGLGGNTYGIHLNTTAARSTETSWWNSTSPTSSVFTIGTSGNANDSGNGMIAYCFAEKKGYSKFGKYTGNGNADGTFIYTGFKPAYLLIKNISSGSTNWHIYDNKRLGYNVDNNMSRANLNNADQTDDDLDILSNGFKLRRVTSALSTNGDTYIYMAFAENPFVTSGVKLPTTAR